MRLSIVKFLAVKEEFQSTHPHGVRPKELYDYISSDMFQSTHPHGVRLKREIKHTLLRKFQSTHPHGVRLTVLLLSRWLKQFQSTHPHGVRLVNCCINKMAINVSIHAPTRGATRRRHGCREVTECFNPRTHTGCDAGYRLMGWLQMVSIHAPTRGATKGRLIRFRRF